LVYCKHNQIDTAGGASQYDDGRALNGAKFLADVIDGVVFEDGVKKLVA